MRLVPLRGLDKSHILAEEPRFCMWLEQMFDVEDTAIRWSEKPRATEEGSGLKNPRGEN